MESIKHGGALSTDGRDNYADNNHNNNKENDDIIVNLYLVRHGETIANLQNLVIGQSESPLTEKGREQARLLGQSSLIQSAKFGRIYSSDLSRAKETAEILWSEQQQKQQQQQPPEHETEAKSSLIRYDDRIRETAKGAREGMPRTMTHDEAVATQLKRNPRMVFPPLETSDEAWNRCQDFLIDILQDALAASLENENESENNDCTFGESPSLLLPIQNILVVSHSSLLRILLQRLLGEDRLKGHPNARFDKNTATGMFYIPNTSVTILQVRIPWNAQAKYDRQIWTESILCEQSTAVHVKELTWAQHLTEEMLAVANGE